MSACISADDATSSPTTTTQLTAEENIDLTCDQLDSFYRVMEHLDMKLLPQHRRELERLRCLLEDPDDGEAETFDYSGGGGTKQAVMWCVGGILMANIVAFGIYFMGTPQTRDGAVAMQQFYTTYLIELILSLDNLFAFYLIFKYFRVREQANMQRVLFWGILGAVLLRAVIVGAGVAMIKQSACVLFAAALVLFWTAWKVYEGEDDDDDNLEDNSIVKCVSKILPVSDHYVGEAFFINDEAAGWKATPLFLVLMVIEFSDIAFAMDSVPAAFGISQDGVVIWTSSMCAILCLRSLYTLVVRFITELEYMNQAIGIVLFFIGFKLVLKVMFDVEVHALLSLLVVLLILSGGAAYSVHHRNQTDPGDPDNSDHPASTMCDEPV